MTSGPTTANEIRTHAFARAALVGNPSDGYFGKTISFVIRQFKATVTLRPADHIEILPGSGDLARYPNRAELIRDVKLFGYYGGQRLLKAATKRFFDHCAAAKLTLPDRGFTLAYDSDIPRLVGLSGSSALIIATLRALMRHYNVAIPPYHLANLALSSERDELKITAGLQDRVVQSYETLLYMDFDKALIESRGYGDYQPLRPATPPPLYVAFDPERAEISDVTHRNLRALFDSGDPTVVGAMKKYRDLTDRGRDAINRADWHTLGTVVDENYEMRRTIMPIAPENHRMVEVARSAGAAAHFSGSGGAICGVYHGEPAYDRLVAAMATIGCTVLKPQIDPAA